MPSLVAPTPIPEDLLATLHARFEPRRQALLAARGGPVGFRDDTLDLRTGDWQIAPIPAALQDRRVEITGPVDRKMMINGLNSGARVFMADFEDSHSPTWQGTLDGHANVRDAVHGTLRLETPDKTYTVAPDPALLVIRVRGLHLDEPHAGCAAGLFDAATILHDNGQAMLAAGTGPYLYIPKIESMEEAAWWHDVLTAIEEAAGLPIGSTKVTVLIETLPAVFQMHEILHALRHRIVALNAGRWDYIFSCIKTFRDDPARILPDRSQITMTVPFMQAYTRLLVDTCHARGALAMGGMSAFIPDRRDPDRNATALRAVREDKEREAAMGFDGTWVAHPDLVPIAMAAFDPILGDRPNQSDARPPCDVREGDLLDFTTDADRTIEGLRLNIDVGIRYLAAWLAGRGAVAIHGLMEDAATAEISRSQVWQWVHHQATLADGPPVTPALVRGLIDSISAGLADDPTVPATLGRATALFCDACLGDFPPFLTLTAYPYLEDPQ